MKAHELKQLQNAYHNKNPIVAYNLIPLTQFWRKIYHEYGIGRLSGKNLQLEAADYVSLANLYHQYSKLPIEQLTDTHTHRLAMSEQHKNEKDSAWSVFGQLLNFVCNGDLPIYHHQQIKYIACNEAMVYSVHRETLAIDAIKQLIVIENGSLISYFNQWQDKLPSAWQNALCIYRGHGENQNTVKQLLTALPMDCQIAFIYGF